jgi:hypothetical protein
MDMLGVCHKRWSIRLWHIGARFASVWGGSTTVEVLTRTVGPLPESGPIGAVKQSRTGLGTADVTEVPPGIAMAQARRVSS